MIISWHLIRDIQKPAEILSNPNLKVLADSKEAGIYIVMEKEGKQIFVMGHPEYDRVTLDGEY